MGASKFLWPLQGADLISSPAPCFVLLRILNMTKMVEITAFRAFLHYPTDLTTKVNFHQASATFNALHPHSLNTICCIFHPVWIHSIRFPYLMQEFYLTCRDDATNAPFVYGRMRLVSEHLKARPTLSPLVFLAEQPLDPLLAGCTYRCRDDAAFGLFDI
jgi:hypothetical protein